MSKLFEHLVTKHDKKPLTYPKLGKERFYWTKKFWNTYIQLPLGKQFIANWKNYNAKATMFWISLVGTPKEAEEYEYTIKIVSSVDEKAGRTKYLLIGTGDCLSCDLSQEDVKKKKKMSTATEVMLFPKDILQKAAEGHDEKYIQWNLVIKKK